MRNISDLLRRLSILLVRTADKCARDNTPFLAAAISFYTMLSLAPALWIVVAAAGQFVGRQSARAAIFDWVIKNVGPTPATFLEQAINQINESSRFATVGGAIATFFAATAAFAALQNSLNRIWAIPDKPVEGIVAMIRGFLRNFLTTRLLAFLAMLLMGALLLASLLISAGMSFAASFMPSQLPAPHFLLQSANFGIASALMMILFGSLYQLLHRGSFRRREIWVGAAVTAFLFAIGTAVIGPYLGSTGLRSA
ncbi:MAG: YihY/virulence factor BrkB family protein, partial [Acidobacteriota bacterium]